MILECEPRLVRSWRPLLPRRAGAARRSLDTVNGMVTADYGWLKKARRRQCRDSDGHTAALSAQGHSMPFPTDTASDARSSANRCAGMDVFAALGPRPLSAFAGAAANRAAIAPCNMRRWRPGAEFLRDLPGALVSCQYDATAEEIAALEAQSGRKIFVPPALDQKNELDRTAAMLSALDCWSAPPPPCPGWAPASGVKTFKFFTISAGPRSARAYEPFAPTCMLVMPQTARRLGRCLRQGREAVIARL